MSIQTLIDAALAATDRFGPGILPSLANRLKPAPLGRILSHIVAQRSTDSG